MDIPSITNQRGFALDDYPDSFGFVLVKAGIDQSSNALSDATGGTVIRDVHKNFEQVHGSGFLVWQYAGHPWSIFRYFVCQEDVPQTISTTLNTDCIYFQYEDTGGAAGYNLFRNGTIVESYAFGLSYREEMMEAFEETGEELPEELDHGIPWDINTVDDEHYYQYVFRSTLRSVSEAEVKNSQEFLNDFFIIRDAWLPAWREIPWVIEGQLPELPQSIFVRVDWVKTS